MEESLITKYDHIFFNESWIGKLIDDYSQTSKEKLDALGILINSYIVSRGYNSPTSSPMSMLMIIGKELNPNLLKSVINDLADTNHAVAIIQNANGNTYISLY